MQSKDSLTGVSLALPRVYSTPSSLDNIAAVPPPFSLSDELAYPVIAVERSTLHYNNYASSFLAIIMWLFTISIISKVVHGPSVSALYHPFLPLSLYLTEPASPLPNPPLL